LHEFTSIKGVREDAIHIILNLKKLRLKLYSQGPETLRLKIRRQGEIYAKDIEANNQVEILTPDLVIATLDDGVELEIEMEVSKGRGYVPADRLKKEGQPLGTIPVDALFSPVSKVHYEVENARVGQMTDYDKLIVEIWTDGSVTPGDALAYSAKILKDSLTTFITFDEEEIPPVQAAYLAHAYKFAEEHGYDVPKDAHFWALIGDSEFREGSLYEAIPDAAERQIANLTWIVDYNRQSLDGHRITNKQIMHGTDDKRIERTATANGWHVIQIPHGRKRLAAFELSNCYEPCH
jgi:DNA-directed RNA polymerase alpha subunit